MTTFTGSKADVLNDNYVLPSTISLINLPNYTTTERDAIPVSDLRPGLVIYNVTLDAPQVLNNDESTWATFTTT